MKPGQAHEAEREVEHEEDDADAHDRQHGVDERVEPEGEHVVDRLEVRGEPRDHAARRVALVKGEAETLEVGEDPLSQLEQYLLADPSRAGDEHPVHDRLQRSRRRG